MKKLFIIPIIIISILLHFYFNNHACNWEICPANEEYEIYTDAWCIKEIHLENPIKSYKECQDILFENDKQTN